LRSVGTFLLVYALFLPERDNRQTTLLKDQRFLAVAKGGHFCLSLCFQKKRFVYVINIPPCKAPNKLLTSCGCLEVLTCLVRWMMVRVNPYPLFSVRANITCVFPLKTSTGSPLEMTTFKNRLAWFGVLATQCVWCVSNTMFGVLATQCLVC
jgi:hypothetical protein